MNFFKAITFLSTIFGITTMFFCSQVIADELHLTFAEAQRQGFKIHIKQSSKALQFQHQRAATQIPIQTKYKKNTLSWPFELPYREGFMGNNFAQYQPYATPGYHGGVDMVLEADSWIYAPVDGLLEAGHYAYTDNPDGSRIKHWKPWPSSGDPSYFELAVVDNVGNRFELHHVDKASLPQDVMTGLNAANFFVKQGMKLGRVVDWTMPFHYDHVHINIHDKEGRWFNPEYFFTLLPDTIKPQCQFLAFDKEGGSQWLQTREIQIENLSHVVVIASDQKNNNKFSQVPTYFEIAFESGSTFFWDFQKNLTNSNGNFADMRNVYPVRVELPNGSVMRQPSGYYPNNVKFAVKLPLPENTGTGQFMIMAKDAAGNICEYRSFPAKNRPRVSYKKLGL